MWRGLLISLWKWMIYIYQILEKWDKSKGDFDISYSAVMGIDFNAYLGEIYSFLARGLAVPIFRQTHDISVT